MKSRKWAFFVLLISLSVSAFSSASDSELPPHGFVPDKATALKIAETVLLSAYGKDAPKGKALVAKLEGDQWSVSTPNTIDGAEVKLDKKPAGFRCLRTARGLPFLAKLFQTRRQRLDLPRRS